MVNTKYLLILYLVLFANALNVRAPQRAINEKVNKRIENVINNPAKYIDEIYKDVDQESQGFVTQKQFISSLQENSNKLAIDVPSDNEIREMFTLSE